MNFLDNIKEEIPESGSETARIAAVHRDRYELFTEEKVFFGKLKASVFYGREPAVFPTVGDFVKFLPSNGSDCQITEVLKRKSYFARRDPEPTGGKQQAVAANFDYVFIMSSLNRDFNLNRIERYLILTRQSGAVPVVILTKSDLAVNVDEAVLQAEAAACGARVIAVSAVNGSGLDKLEEYLSSGKTAVFLGMSGVGKSSLLNALMGRDVMEVNGIREDDDRGRHTTTRRQLVTLPSGAMVIDTPGMRSIGMWDADDGLNETYADIRELAASCRFSDCTHTKEPDCAIRAAIENGELSASRMSSYLSLQKESAYSENRASFLRAKQARNKKIAIYSKSITKERNN